jgi:hypothetical protein
VGRNPPKNLSTSLKSYLKKSDPVKLAKSRERVRQERAVETALERFESMVDPEVPTAEEEVQEIVQEIIDTTGQLPSEAQVEDIKVEVLQERRKRGVQAGDIRGPYFSKSKKEKIAKETRLQKGLLALMRNVSEKNIERRRMQQAQQSPLLREMIAQQFPQSPSDIFSLQLQSPTDSGAVFDSLSGQLVELRHPQTGALVDPTSDFGKFLLKRQSSK